MAHNIKYQEPPLMDIDEESYCGPIEEISSPGENTTCEEDLEEEHLDEWIEFFHESKRVTDVLFLEFQRILHMSWGLK